MMISFKNSELIHTIRFKKINVTSLHLKIYKSNFHFDINFLLNYIEKLIPLGIDTTNLMLTT
jgi:hypothetical protein